MSELSIGQRFAVIGAMPSRTVRGADTALFDAIANAVEQMPALSLVASIERAFASLGLAITAAEAAPIARALALAEDAAAPFLRTVIARVSSQPAPAYA